MNSTLPKSNNINRDFWLDNLRSFITVLVVAHHASLSYTTFAYFDTTKYINSTNPIVDNSRWIVLDVFANFNDIFFMPLMFLISGLFVYRSLRKKGASKFIGDRFKRLGIPFIIGVTFVIPIAYFPSFYLTTKSVDIFVFVSDFLFNQLWPVGPPWFIWILLLFNLVAVIVPIKLYTLIGDKIFQLTKTPIHLVLVFFVLALLSFIPISLWLGQYYWTGFGPFDFQVNRFFLYFLFFALGVCIGSGDWENYFFKNSRFLNISWVTWVSFALVSFLFVELFTYGVWDFVREGMIGVNSAWSFFDMLFVATSILACFAFMALFKQKIQRANVVWCNLSANAFGIYLVHYVFITWMQFALLKVGIPAVGKFLMVFLGSLLLSWILVNSIRKVKFIASLL